MKPRSCGDVGIWAVREAVGPYRDPLEVYPDATQETVDRHRHWLEPVCLDRETGKMIFAFQSYLVRTGRYTILIDCCVGEDKERPDFPNWHRRKWPWLANLKAAGATPEDIDFVFCTHLHIDHVGWNTKLENGRWVPTFPNATYLFGAAEYRYWEAAHKDIGYMHGMFVDSVLPVVEAGRVAFVDKDFEIDTGFTIEPTPGHTPGHNCLNLARGGETVVFSGDLMHHPLQVPEPQLSTVYCVRPDESRRTRTAFVERYAETDTVILPAHFPGASAGRIRARNGATLFDFCEE